MAKISVVIPTRSRAHLLPYAVRSVLAQTYRDIEVVICDNDSKDNTAEVAKSFLADTRVKYIRTPESLAMPDNWDYALKHATGDYIAYLTDDSVLFPKTLEYVLNELSSSGQLVAVWRHAAYYYPDWFEGSRQNVLYIPRMSNRSVVVKSTEMLARLYDMDSGAWVDIPKSLNSMSHRNVVEAVVKKQGRFFPPSCPDYTSAAGVLFNTQTYLLINKPIYIDSVTQVSLGATGGYNLGEAARTFISEFKGGALEVAVLGIPVSPSGIAKSLENVSLFYPERSFMINRPNLLSQVADRLIKVEANGGNVGEYWGVLNEAIGQDAGLRRKVRVSKIISGLKWRLVNIARKTTAMSFLEYFRGFDIYRGEDVGFRDVEEAAKYASSKVF